MFNQGSQANPSTAGALFNQVPGSNQYQAQNPAAAVVPGNSSISTGVPGGSVGAAPTVPYQAWKPNSGDQVPTGSEQNLGGKNYTVPTLDPQMTQQMMQYLMSQIGQGLPAYGGSTALPGGGTSAPGALSAPLNSVDQQLLDFYSGKGPGTPGESQLASQAAGIDATPQWQQMIAAMNGPQGAVAQQEAQLKQQFGFAGDISSSPFAQAMTQFGEQTALDQNALLASLTQQNLGLSQQAATTLQSGAQSFGGDIQTLNNQAIQQQLAQFMTDLPQNSPLLQYLFSGATASPSAIGQKTAVGSGGAALTGAGSALQGIADLYSAINPPSSSGS